MLAAPNKGSAKKVKHLISSAPAESPCSLLHSPAQFPLAACLPSIQELPLLTLAHPSRAVCLHQSCDRCHQLSGARKHPKSARPSAQLVAHTPAPSTPGPTSPQSPTPQPARKMADSEKNTTTAPTNGVMSNGAQSQPDEKMEDGAKNNEKKSEKNDDKNEKEEKEPAGGFDSTPIPKAPPGYTVKFTFHRATHLPMSDINSFSSDPYILAQLNTSLASRHKEDPILRFRSHTIRRSTDPIWDSEWIVANVPASGFKLKIRIYDEDPADHDDRLGNVHVNVPHIDEKWPGIHDQEYKIKKRMGSKRAYLVRIVASCFKLTEHLNGRLFVSAEVLGRTEGNDGGRCYTLGPQWWTMHYSPMLGRLTNRKDDGDEEGKNNGNKSGRAQRYKYVAISINPFLFPNSRGMSVAPVVQ